MKKSSRRYLYEKIQFHIQLFGVAWIFLTRMAYPIKINFTENLLSRSTVYFPVVGAVLGALLSFVFILSNALFESNLLSVLVMMIAGIYMTGAFHEDGFADCCDALGGGYSPKETLTIMKDSRLGTYGSVGLFGILALKTASLWLIAERASAIFFGVVVVSQSLSRWFPLFAIRYMNYVRLEGKAKPVADGLPKYALLYVLLFITMLLVGLVLCLEIQFSPVFYMLIAGTLGAGVIAHKLYKALNGYTGDGLGAIQQVSEVAMLLAIVASH